MSLQNQQKIQPGEQIVLLHYGELALKGNNRGQFEKQLHRNLKDALDALPVKEVLRLQGRMVVRVEDRVSDVVERVRRTPGVANVAAGKAVETDQEAIFSGGLEVANNHSFSSFAVRARRAYKEFPLNSQEINVELGDQVRIDTGAEVELDHPEFTLHVELLQDRTFLYGSKRKAVGGLPVGASGKVLSLLSGGIDSPVASYLMMKRGCRTAFVHFHSFPLTNRAGQEKAEELTTYMNRYQRRSTLYLVPFADCQQEIVANCPSDFRILLYRRFMVRIAEKIAEQEHADALITGESLGQVSSQTLTNLAGIERVADLPVLRPLIGMDKQEIVDTAKEIGTYETSIEPHQDCCSYFMPDHPATSSHEGKLAHAEQPLDQQALIEETLDNVEKKEINTVQ